jgi:hypothetical protein
MDKHIILGVHVTDRVVHAGRVQQVFTEFGAWIKTRLGLHEVNGGDRCTSKNGLVLIEFIGTEDQAKAMAAALQAVDGVYTQVMVFDHPA